MTITMKLIILYSDVFNPIAPFASLLHLSPLQKHKFISTSTDCFPQIICTAWSSRLHCASWANVALAQPRNKGTVDINIQGYLYLRLLWSTINTDLYLYQDCFVIKEHYLDCHILLLPRNSFSHQMGTVWPICHQTPSP